MTYALFGPGWCFLINGLSFIAIIAALAKMKLPAFVPRPRSGSMTAELKEGLRYVAREPIIRTIMLLLIVISLFGFAFTNLIPAWAVNILHGDALVSQGVDHGQVFFSGGHNQGRPGADIFFRAAVLAEYPLANGIDVVMVKRRHLLLA